MLNLALNSNSVFESPNKGISKSNLKDPYLGFKINMVLKDRKHWYLPSISISHYKALWKILTLIHRFLFQTCAANVSRGQNFFENYPFGNVPDST